MHLEEFQGKFDGPVSLKIRDVDWIRALDAVARARAIARANDRNEEKEPEEEKNNVDQQLRQLKENYERMTEAELYACAEKAYDSRRSPAKRCWPSYPGKALLFDSGWSGLHVCWASRWRMMRG